MKLALVFFSVLTGLSLWFAVQQPSPSRCSGKPLQITMLPGSKMTGPSLPLRFGGTRPYPGPPVNAFPSQNAQRLVIKTHDEFTDFWKQFTSKMPPDNTLPPPEIDFTKEMIIVSAMGRKPSCCYWTFIDGACEVDGHVEVFVSNVDDINCIGVFPTETYPADAVRIPRSDLPVVFRETQIPCEQWAKQNKMN